MRWDHIYCKLFFSKDSHVLIGLPVMRIKGSHFIEDLSEIVFDFFSYIDALFEQINIAHPCVD